MVYLTELTSIVVISVPMLCSGSSAVVHKTFHSYTVRAGQGGSQAAADGKAGSKRSAGAGLRRYNEAQHLLVSAGRRAASVQLGQVSGDTTRHSTCW